ncbi:putative serine/threonine protein kinase ENV7 NDAI_0F01340 [Naumovozyma dairenensis CBS 421]|uniref:non-specific serine/threonine protein kinase n=1 Tax=Naumovozyma dairenensis (strain ATCC 10597 / BCRC 20456 / CBS 421 / NBRC 0211 / NRRL Y-12639) TaxID=1071378 RepID=G0WCE2_NAUDC|nr:hypothetical protein NDAI_0F01340 [Naumovozyma dairenensis CBS 421]CCD25453.1 hypothetical protein NDAI_0F01340 [Naumovozyma dairenensis CBS 421]
MLQSLFDKCYNICKASCCSCCCGYGNRLNSIIVVRTRHYKIEKLLKESPLSFIYLVTALDGGPPPISGALVSEDTTNDKNKIFVIKRIHCPFGDIESVSYAMREIENYKKFKNKFIMSCLDSELVQNLDGSKTCHILLPFYPMGSLQDAINRHILNGTSFSEAEIIRITIGIAKGLLYLNDPNSRDIPTTEPTNETMSITLSLPSTEVFNDYNDDEEGISPTNESDQLLSNTSNNRDVTKIFTGNSISYAHRNIKPSNILFSSDGSQVISDLSSTSKSNIHLKTGKQILDFKEWIDSCCSVPFMSPELLDLKMGSKIDEKVDIWSLGCTIYTIILGVSPFEREVQLTGKSIRMLILSANFTFPEGMERHASRELIDTIKQCLQVDPTKRPTINQLLNDLQALQSTV